MKKTIFLLLLAISLFSCTSKDEPKAFKVVPNAQISIRPATGALKVKSTMITDNHLSTLEIVKQTAGISAYNIPVYGNQPVSWGFDISQRDTINLALKMWASGIINESGYVPDFIEALDLVFFRPSPINATKRDTVAYIPNSVLRNAESLINNAYAAGNSEEVYRLFNEQFVFTPITGAEWRALKAKNLQ